MWSSTASKASAWSCFIRCTVRPMRTQSAGTALNENAFRWSSATTMSASGRVAVNRSPIRAISVMHSTVFRRPSSPQARW